MKKRVGILELGAACGSGVYDAIVNTLEKKQYVGVTPQAISVWCRQLGHQVFYATFYGNGDPMGRLPDNLDTIFIAAFTYAAPLAYALSKAYRLRGTRTVLGGPHAKAFPRDALRYFDWVVLECDKTLIDDLLADRFPLTSVVSSPKPYDDTPTIEERLPEIRASTFWNGRPFPYSSIPMLASIGCPYSCDFCVDWRSEYRALPQDRLEADLRFAARVLPGVPLLFYDPNFGIRFSETLATFESIPPEQRSPYAMESSLTNLRSPERLRRLRETKCLGVAPGIESWTHYSNKAGVGQTTPHQKLDQVVEHLEVIHTYLPYIQANFIMGIDSDAGDEPFELAKEFVRRTPFVFPCFFVPVAYGGTPLYTALLAENRILRAMPFTFYFTPHLTLILKNYDALTYFRKMADLYELLTSVDVLRRRLAAKSPWLTQTVNIYRTFAALGARNTWRRMAGLLAADPEFRAFHAGEAETLPGYYVGEYQRQLGRYAELMPIAESRPVLEEGVLQPLMSA